MHICTDESLFLEFKKLGKLPLVRTGGGPVILQGVGTVKIEFFTGYKDGTAQYSAISLRETLYIPGFLLNIVSGDRLYALGGTLIK